MAEIDEALFQFITGIKNEIIKNHIAAGQDVSGKTISSYEVIIEGTNGKLVAAPYVFALDEGRAPTRNGQAGDPTLKQLIYNWMQEKGIKGKPYIRKNGPPQSQQEANASLAFIIARKIHQDGTKLYRTGGSGVISNVITDKRIESFIDVFTTGYLDKATTEVIKGLQSIKLTTK